MAQRLATQAGLHPQECEDAAQHAMLHAMICWQKSCAWEREAKTQRAYVRSCVVYGILDYRRDRARHMHGITYRAGHPMDMHTWQSTMDKRGVSGGETAVEVGELFEKLHVFCKEWGDVCWKYIMEDVSIPVLARSLECSTSRIWGILHAGLGFIEYLLKSPQEYAAFRDACLVTRQKRPGWNVHRLRKKTLRSHEMAREEA